MEKFTSRMGRIHDRGIDPKRRWWLCISRRLPKIDLASIEEAVRELLPESKIRHISLIGRSIMEVLTVIEHRRAILDITRAAGMIHMPHFNVFDFTLRDRKTGKFP